MRNGQQRYARTEACKSGKTVMTAIRETQMGNGRSRSEGDGEREAKKAGLAENYEEPQGIARKACFARSTINSLGLFQRLEVEGFCALLSRSASLLPKSARKWRVLWHEGRRAPTSTSIDDDGEDAWVLAKIELTEHSHSKISSHKRASSATTSIGLPPPNRPNRSERIDVEQSPDKVSDKLCSQRITA